MRLSTLGYDTEFYLYYFSNKVIQNEVLHVACDNITTLANSAAFVTGDVLNLFGRSSIGGFFPDPLQQIPLVLERLIDIEQVLVLLHLGLYEIHLDLLKRAISNAPSPPDQLPLHSMELANDIITSNGADTVVGDSTTLFIQIDRPGVDGFQFSLIDKSVINAVKSSLSAISSIRDANFDSVVSMLAPSDPVRAADVPFADVPYYMSIGSDEIFLTNNEVIVVGDVASIGIIFSESATPNQLPSPLYLESIKNLRTPPSVSSYLYKLRLVPETMANICKCTLFSSLHCLCLVCTKLTSSTADMVLQLQRK